MLNAGLGSIENIIQYLTRDTGSFFYSLQRPSYIGKAEDRGEYAENCLSHPSAAWEDGAPAYARLRITTSTQNTL